MPTPPAHSRRFALMALVVGTCAVLLSLLTAGDTSRASSLTGLGTAGFESGELSHYFIFEDSGAGPQPVFQRFVQLAAPAPSLTANEVAARIDSSSRLTEPVSFEIKTADGAVAYRGVVDVPIWLRGEFAVSESGTIDGHVLPLATRTFVVRAPVLAGSQLRLVDSTGVESTFDTEEVVRTYGSSTGAASQPPPNSANRVDLLIMGDGYTAAQEAAFGADAATLENEFFDLTPFDEYRNFVNVSTLFVPSTESGADHPPYDATCSQINQSCCGDPAMQSDPLEGQFVNTAFNAHFCSFNIHRLIGMNLAAVLAAASAMPDWDAIMLMVNDVTYGGAGGYVSVVSTHPASTNVAQHEFGHSFAELADEYSSPYPGFPACSDVTALPDCERNVTDETTRALIKWAVWILGSTPIPTPAGSIYATVVGLFEGARYLTTGMYRSGDNCLMRSLGRPFCDVPSEAYVLKLYQGGWGVPAAGIDLIEPGSENYLPGSTVEATMAGVEFEVALLQPIGAPPVDVTWSVDGVPVSGEHADAFSFVPTAAGTYTVDLDVFDVTPLVNAASPGADSLLHSRTWDVSVTGPTPTTTNTPTNTNTPTITPTPSPTPTKQPAPGDTDGDGCSDQQENP